MKITNHRAVIFIILTAGLSLVSGCGRKTTPTTGASDAAHSHEHHAPHGGTPVVLGDEAFHLEFVRAGTAGKMSAYVLDGELENFIRIPASEFVVVATLSGAPQTLTFHAVPNPATGETVGDTSLFETQADWLKTTPEFDAVLSSITVRGSTFQDVKFNFPKGNE